MLSDALRCKSVRCITMVSFTKHLAGGNKIARLRDWAKATKSSHVGSYCKFTTNVCTYIYIYLYFMYCIYVRYIYIYTVVYTKLCIYACRCVEKVQFDILWYTYIIVHFKPVAADMEVPKFPRWRPFQIWIMWEKKSINIPHIWKGFNTWE